jgi:small subunit ribosomal protein S6e
MVEYKLVIGSKDGKCHQKEIKSPEADNLHGKRLGETLDGNVVGLPGYEFLITGGSDKCGFPMRKGIQEHRKMVLVSGGPGFSGKQRSLRKKTKSRNQKGLLKRRTVCGEKINSIIRQINLKVVKEGSQPLGEAPAAEEPAKKE